MSSNVYLWVGIGIVVVIVCTAITTAILDHIQRRRRQKSTQECGECVHFDEFEGATKEKTGRGLCRRFPPTGVLDSDGVSRGIFPTVFYSDSCAEFDHKGEWKA